MEDTPDDWWTNGLCSVFAVALQRHFGGELYAIVNHSDLYPQDDELVHAYCVKGGLAYDADGPHPLEEASDTSDYEIPEMDKGLDVKIIWRAVNIPWLDRHHGDFSLAYLPDARE